MGLDFGQINPLHNVKQCQVLAQAHLIDLGKTHDGLSNGRLGIVTHASMKVYVAEKGTSRNEKLPNFINTTAYNTISITYSAHVDLGLG